MRRLLGILISSFLLLSCADASVKQYTLEVVAEYPHDTGAYTQGLFFEDGQLYESTGQNGKSSFRKVDLTTGEVLEIIREVTFKQRMGIGQIAPLTYVFVAADGPDQPDSVGLSDVR